MCLFRPPAFDRADHDEREDEERKAEKRALRKAEKLLGGEQKAQIGAEKLPPYARRDAVPAAYVWQDGDNARFDARSA